jgi:hypothetical protein
MKVLIYTWPPDYVMAALSARSILAAGGVPVLVIDRADPPLYVEGVEVIRSNFPRNGNLNGKAFILGHLALMQELAGEDEWIAKGDSDVWWKSLDWIHGPATGVALCHEGVHAFYGLAYALRVSRLPEMLERARDLDETQRLPEDLTIGTLAGLSGGVQTFRHLDEGSPLTAYNWESERPVEEWKRLYQVVLFQRIQGRKRRDVIEAMKRFSE